MHVCTRYEVSVIKGLSTDTSNVNKFIVLYSKHIVHGGKVQNVKIFKNYHFKNIVHNCIISGVYMAPVQVHN